MHITLIPWFTREQRSMPWRDNPIPYYVWISEMMLQQTQVITVIPFFERFIACFPDIESLAKAELGSVLKLWEGLGYYSRARNLHKTAQIVVAQYKSQLPSDYDELQKLPGIGPYIAAAITSIAFGNPVPVVDGNVMRVCTRFWGIPDDIRSPKLRDVLFKRLLPEIKASYSPSAFNQGMMELGALICKPKNPVCTTCPLATQCVAFQSQRIAQYPYKSKAKEVPTISVVVGLIYYQDRILIARRKPTQMLGGLWEFPGGKKLMEESDDPFLIQKVFQETGLRIQITHKLKTIRHAFTHFKINLTGYECRSETDQAMPFASDEVKWILPDRIIDYPFSTAALRLV